MAHAEKCPVCKGVGSVEKLINSNSEGTAMEAVYVSACHGCGGQGWVQVND